jgi:hypothetical protein
VALKFIKKIKKKFEKNVPPVIDDNQVGEENEEEETEEPKKEVGNSQLSLDVERLKARVESLNELKKLYDEKFDMLSEQLGEIRSLDFQKEKQIGKLEAKAVKAVDLVESVQPEKLMESVLKSETKLEAMKGQLVGNREFSEGILEQLKEIKRVVSMFEDTEQILEMNKDVKNELLNMQRITGIVENRSSKVESIFLEVQKKFTDFEKYSSIADEIRESSQNSLKELESSKVRMKGLATKEELKKTNDVLGNELLEKEKFQAKMISLFRTMDTLKESYGLLKGKYVEMQKVSDEMAYFRDFIKKKEVQNQQNREFETEILEELEKLKEVLANKKVEKRVNNVDLRDKLQGLRTMNEDKTIETLRDYILNTSKMGFNKLDIRKELIRKGWDREEVDNAFLSITS